jgi:hypothetical protein
MAAKEEEEKSEVVGKPFFRIFFFWLFERKEPCLSERKHILIADNLTNSINWVTRRGGW